MSKGDFQIKDNVRKRNFRSSLINIGNSEYPNGIPANHKYVSLAGTFIQDGKIKKHSEIWFGLRLKLFKTNQVIAIDSNKAVCQKNQNGKIQIIHDEISDAIADLVVSGNKIAFLSLDFMRTPEMEYENMIKIFKFLSAQKTKCVVVMNFIIRSRRDKYNPELENITKRVTDNKVLNKILRENHWNGRVKANLDYVIESKTSKTKMRAITLIKN